MVETRLRRWRIEKGYTQAEVADLTGLSVPMISRAEAGKRTIAPHTRVVVARRLGVRVADLFEVEPISEEVA